MTPEQWKEMTPYFTPEECGEGMSYAFMLHVMALRRRLNVSMHVHAGFELSGHAPKSFHGTGRALDFHVENVSPRRVLSEIDRLGLFGGVGWYPGWSHPGFHIDDRPHHQYQRWVCREPGTYIYLMG